MAKDRDLTVHLNFLADTLENFFAQKDVTELYVQNDYGTIQITRRGEEKTVTHAIGFYESGNDEDTGEDDE